MNTEVNQQPVLRCNNIIISSQGFTEADGDVRVLFVPAAQIDHCILKFGRADHRPVISLALGIILSIVGILGLFFLILTPRGLRYELGMIAIGLVGGSLVFDAVKKRFFLEVHHKKGISRLFFSKKAKLSDIQGFCQKVSTVYSYRIVESNSVGQIKNPDFALCSQKTIEPATWW